jgi:hypothetical protein
MDKSAAQALKERKQRLRDAVQLKQPDRVPISLGLNYFPAKFTGTTTWAAYYDFPNWKQAYIKAARHYEPDRFLVVPNQKGKGCRVFAASSNGLGACAASFVRAAPMR